MKRFLFLFSFSGTSWTATLVWVYRAAWIVDRRGEIWQRLCWHQTGFDTLAWILNFCFLKLIQKWPKFSTLTQTRKKYDIPAAHREVFCKCRLQVWKKSFQHWNRFWPRFPKTANHFAEPIVQLLPEKLRADLRDQTFGQLKQWRFHFQLIRVENFFSKV